MRRLIAVLMVVSACIRGSVVAQTPLEGGMWMVHGALLEGDWVNVDPRTRGMVRITLLGQKIHPYGACHPTACDWGELPVQVFASSVDAHDSFSLLAKQTTSFSETLMAISLGSDGRLRVQNFTHFTDGSRRGDYSSVDYFRPNEGSTSKRR